MNQWQQLHRPMVAKLNIWDITPRAKAIGLELANLSFGLGLPEVELWQTELEVLTGYRKECVSKAVEELMALGVLQRRGRAGRPRIFRLLPNAEMVEPGHMIDAAAARMVRADIVARNVDRRIGDDHAGEQGGSRGQAMLLQTTEEELSQDLAMGSAERAMQDEPVSLREMVRRSIEGAGELPSGQLDEESRLIDLPGGQVELPGGQVVAQVAQQATTAPSCQPGNSPPRGQARAGAPSRVNVNVPPPSHNVLTLNVERDNGSGAADPAAPERPQSISAVRNPVTEEEAQNAFYAVQEVADPGEFNAYRRKWWDRCHAEPEVIIEAASETKARIRRGDKITTPGGHVFRLANKWLKPLGRSLKSIFWI